MPRGQHSQRVPIAAGSDRNYQMIDYEPAYQRVSSPSESNSSIIYQIPPTRVKRTAIYQDHRPEHTKRINDAQEAPPSVATPPRKITHHDTTSQAPQRRQRLWYVPPQSNVKVFDKRPNWHGQTKVDSHNEEFVERLQSHRRPVVFNEVPTWEPNPQFETHEEYLKNRRQKFPQEQRVNANAVSFADGSLIYDQHTDQYHPVRLPPTGNRNLVRPRRHRQAPSSNGKRERWYYISPKTNSHNEVLAEYIEKQPKPQIFNEQLRWRSRPKINSHNDSYDPNQSYYRPIFDSKLRWHARSKIDTGFLRDDY